MHMITALSRKMEYNTRFGERFGEVWGEEGRNAEKFQKWSAVLKMPDKDCIL